MARGDNNRVRAALHEAQILALLTEKPRTLAQLAQAMGLSLDSLYLYRDRLRSVPKRIYVVSHDHTGARPAPVYAAGDLPDAEYTPARKPRLGEDRKDKQRRRLRELMKGNELTAEAAALRLCLSVSRARFYINELRSAKPKKAYIKRWQHPGHRGDLAPVYALGNKPDAPKPRQSRADRYRKDKANPDRYDRILAQRRTRDALRKATARKHGIFSALGL